jgi:hypothetical protein
MKLLKHIKDLVQGKTSLGKTRNSKWPKVRENHLKSNPKCAVCGGNKKLEVHHIEPFHINPDKELDLTNLITLCEYKANGINCHLAIGHLGNYKSLNPKVKEDAFIWNKKIKSRT